MVCLWSSASASASASSEVGASSGRAGSGRSKREFQSGRKSLFLRSFFARSLIRASIWEAMRRAPIGDMPHNRSLSSMAVTNCDRETKPASLASSSHHSTSSGVMEQAIRWDRTAFPDFLRPRGSRTAFILRFVFTVTQTTAYTPIVKFFRVTAQTWGLRRGVWSLPGRSGKARGPNRRPARWSAGCACGRAAWEQRQGVALAGLRFAPCPPTGNPGMRKSEHSGTQKSANPCSPHFRRQGNE